MKANDQKGDLMERLGDVLTGLKEDPRADMGIFVKPGGFLNPDTQCHLAAMPKYDSETEIERIEKELGVVYLLDIFQAFDVVDNARSQLPNVTEKQLVFALSHYHRNDAFLDLEPRTKRG